jgi:hypothetical protein
MMTKQARGYFKGLLGAAAIAVAGCGGGSHGGGTTFVTRVPGGTPLGELTGDQVAQLCSDQAQFLTEASYAMDACRFSAAFAASLEAELSPDESDDDLRAACTAAYEGCLNPDGGGSGDLSCGPRSAACTATVTELGACLNDEVAEVHALATAVPSCDEISRAALTSDGGTGDVQTAPASCMLVASKCLSVPDQTAAFVGRLPATWVR